MTSSLKLWDRFFSYFKYITSIGKGNENLCFCSNQIGNLVAIATYSSHRLILGKEEIDKFFCLNGDIWIFYRHVCRVVLYVSYNFCLNR